MRKACIAGFFLLAACSSGPTASTPPSTSPSAPPGTTPSPDRPPTDPTSPSPIDPEPTTPPSPIDPAPTTPPATTPPSTTPPSTTPPRATGPGSHRRCGWINSPDGYTVFQQHAAEFEAIHPKWHVMLADGVMLRNAGQTNDAALRATARAAGVAIIPLVDTDHDKARLRLMINDAQKRTAHIAELMKLVDNNAYDGIEIDYEGLWTAADRAPFTAFMRELATALHGRGKELAMAIPGIPVDSGTNAYDYTALVGFVDTIHVMGYDFHWTGGAHMGPIAPLGWIDGVFARAKATGHPERFILGVPNYAVSSGYFSSSTRAAIASCTGAVQTTTDHMTSCAYGNFEAGRAPHCTTASNGTIWFDDLASMEEKIAAAKRQGGRGVTYWTLGDELPGYFDLVRKYYP